MAVPLTLDDLISGVMYRAKHPITVKTIVRDLLDDRIITWINTDRTVLQYNGPAVPESINNPTVRAEEFLKWASHIVTMED